MPMDAHAGSCSIVVPIFQDSTILDLFLESLLRTVEMPSHVVLINDGSGCAAARVIEQFVDRHHPLVTTDVITHERPHGGARSLNEGLARTRDGAVIFADSDLILIEGWQRRLLDTLAARPDCGSAGALLLYPQTGGVQHCGLAFSDGIGRHLFLNAPPESIPLATFRVQAVVFALCAISRAAIDRCGTIDEEFFNGYEDLDYHMRIRAAGFEVVVEPAARAYHWERSNGPHRATNRKRNLGRFWSRWGGAIEPDLFRFSADKLSRALNGQNSKLECVDICGDRVDARNLWAALTDITDVSDVADRSFFARGWEEIWLPQALGNDGHRTPSRLLIAVDNFVQLVANRYWFDIRSFFRDDDLVIDLYGNVIELQRVIGGAWPGTKVR